MSILNNRKFRRFADDVVFRWGVVFIGASLVFFGGMVVHTWGIMSLLNLLFALFFVAMVLVLVTGICIVGFRGSEIAQELQAEERDAQRERERARRYS